MLVNKVAVITGSTSGIGLGIADCLAAAGCQVMMNGFGDPTEIENLRKSLEKKHDVQVAFSGADLSDPKQVIGLIADAEAKFGRVDILVNNAGIQFTAPVEEFPREKWDAILAINLSAAFHAIKAVLPGMKKRDFGRIVNIASVHGLVASKEKAAYVAAKHGILGLTKVVALENATSHITINAICPGWVHTPLVHKQIEERAKKENISVDQATKDLLMEKQPSLRFATPEDIGHTVVFLCSDAAHSITGVALPVDGGWTAQ